MLDRRVLAQLFVGAVLLGLFFWSISRSGWEKQFKATGEALEKAHSFRMTITRKDPQGGRFEVMSEANCPHDFHSLQRHYAPNGTMIPTEDIEIWSEGNTHIMRQNDRVIDTKTRFGAPNCGSKVILEVPPMMVYQVIYMRGHGERGSKKTLDGEQCREWKIQMPEGGGWGDLYTMCVDENNLPLEVVTKDGSMVAHASHWNQPIALPKPPELTPTDTTSVPALQPSTETSTSSPQ